MIPGTSGIEALGGRTITVIEGAVEGSNMIIFKCNDGAVFRMYHDQSCCEIVLVEDICGDVADLIGSPILKAYTKSNDEKLPLDPQDSEGDFLWTFYDLATINGYVTIRWYGTSNGYYSVDVDFVQDKINKEPQS